MTYTSLEAIVLTSFETYGDLESTLSDSGVSWTDVSDLAKRSGLGMGTVKGVLGSLAKKGLVHSDDEGTNSVCLSDDGIHAHFELLAQGGNVEAPVGAEFEAGQEALVGEQEAALFMAALIKAGADEEQAKAMGQPYPGIICSTLRAFAMGWSGTRKSFIATAQTAGFNKVTAATQWQRARSTK